MDIEAIEPSSPLSLLLLLLLLFIMVLAIVSEFLFFQLRIPDSTEKEKDERKMPEPPITELAKRWLSLDKV
jgi:biopolymer transport protein ExbD